MSATPAVAQGVQNAGEPEVSDAEKRRIFFRVFPSVMLPMFLAAIDQTIVATALPAMAGDLGDVERISWVVVSYLIASTIAAPVYGRLGDAMGRKRLLFGALILFVVASVLCALAPTTLLLCAARVLQGFGGGGLMTLCQALIGEAVAPRERARYQGYLASVFVASSTFGPVAGGWMTQHLGWRSVFLVNLPLGLVAGIVAMRLPAIAAPKGRLRFDFLGLGLFAGTVIPLLLALEQAQQFSLAVLPGTAVLLAVSLGSLWLLLRQERRAATPLIPVALLRHPAIWRADLLAVSVGACIVASVTFVPVYLQVVRGVQPGEVGLLMLPQTAGIALGSMFTGRLIARTGRTAVMPTVGLVISTATLVLIAALAGSVPIRGLPWMFLVLSFTLGTAMPVVQMTTQIAAGPKNLGAIAASVQFSRSIGAALGTAIVGAILFATLAAQNPETAGMFVRVVEIGGHAMDVLTPARRVVMQQEFATAFRAAFLAIAVFAAGGWVLAATLPVRRL